MSKWRLGRSVWRRRMTAVSSMTQGACTYSHTPPPQHTHYTESLHVLFRCIAHNKCTPKLANLPVHFAFIACVQRDRRRPWVSLSEAVFQDELFALLFASEANSKIRQLLLAGADGGGLRLVVRAYAYAHPYLVLSHADSLVYVFSLSGSALCATHCCFLRPLSCLALFEHSRRRHSSTSPSKRQRSLWL